MIQQYRISFDQSLIDDIYNLKETTKGVRNSNVGGWHSPAFYDPPEWFKDYSNIISKTADKKIHNLWFNINGPGHSNSWHTHGTNYSFVGAWYLKTPENCGNLEIEINDTVEVVVPRTALFITHPCGINHRVTENLSDQSRISVAFNFK
jgi:hypothetical protein